MGFISLGLGLIGVVVPGLPTTPLVLLAAYFFSKSSPRFHKWLLNNKYYGKSIRDYQANPSITLKTKVFSQLIMWTMVLYSSLILIESTPWKIFVLGLGVVGTWYVVFHIPTRSREKVKSDHKD